MSKATEELHRARMERDRANDACPHWDFGWDDSTDEDCCRDRREADERYDKAIKAVRREGMS